MATNYGLFQKFCIHVLKKRRVSLAVFITHFECGPCNRLKNLSAAVNATKVQPGYHKEGRGLNQKLFVFFAQKLSNLGPLLNNSM